MNRIEHNLAQAMHSQLLPYCTWVRTESKLSNSTLAKAGSALRVDLGFVPVLQPDIDICFLFNGELCAAELKVFTQGRGSASFYEGIGQALALHRYGVDRAALWFVFEDEDQLRRLASCAWYFVRDQTQLRLDFTPFLLRNGATNQPRLQIWRYESQHHADPTGSMFDETPPHFRYQNPLLQDPEERNDTLIVRRHVQEWLGSKLRVTDRNPIDPIDVDPCDPGPTGPEHPQET